MRILVNGFAERCYCRILPVLHELQNAGHQLILTPPARMDLPSEIAFTQRLAGKHQFTSLIPTHLYGDDKVWEEIVDWSPDLVLTDTVLLYHTSCPYLFNQVNAPVLAWQHGLFQDWRYIEEVYLAPGNVNSFMVWGENSHSLNNGAVVVGCPQWDSLPTTYDGGYLLIIGADETEEHTRELFDEMEVRELAKLFPKTILRPHPGNKEDIPSIASDYSLEIDSITPALNLVAGSSVVVNTTCSTIGLEAMLMNKPVITRYRVFLDSGTTVHPVSDTLQAVKNLLSGRWIQDYSKFVKTQTTPNATRNMVKYIEKYNS